MVSENKKTKSRKKIPKATEAKILIQSRRRCCLCFHFHDDLKVKTGQIAHINKKRDDNSEENLAFLCFDHHDNYDSTRSQSKGITPMEVRHAKQILNNIYSKKNNTEPVKITISIEGDFDKLQPEERNKLLTRALVASQVTDKDITIHNIEPGSVKFTIEVSTDNALQIIEAFNDNKLSDIGVIDINLNKAVNKSAISFSPTFKAVSHGITQRVVKEVLLSPDSNINLNEVLKDKKILLNIELYLKQISYKHSVIIIAKREDAIVTAILALPFSHNELGTKRGDDPWDVFNTFIQKYGIYTDFGFSSELLFLKSELRVPFGSNETKKLSDYLISSVGKSGKENNIKDYYSNICIIERGTIISTVVNVDLMFTLSKNKYYHSLKKIGINLKNTHSSSSIHMAKV